MRPRVLRSSGVSFALAASTAATNWSSASALGDSGHDVAPHRAIGVDVLDVDRVADQRALGDQLVEQRLAVLLPQLLPLLPLPRLDQVGRHGQVALARPRLAAAGDRPHVVVAVRRRRGERGGHRTRTSPVRDGPSRCRRRTSPTTTRRGCSPRACGRSTRRRPTKSRCRPRPASRAPAWCSRRSPSGRCPTARGECSIRRRKCRARSRGRFGQWQERPPTARPRGPRGQRVRI